MSVTEKEFNEFVSGEKDPLMDLVCDEPEPPKSVTLFPSAKQRQENSYRTEPKKLYPYYKARKVMEKVLGTLSEVEYDSERCSKLVTELCDQIRCQVKHLSPRYKTAVIVHIGKKDDQGIMMGSRCLWNAGFDTFSSASFTNSSLFAVGVVYASYFE